MLYCVTIDTVHQFPNNLIAAQHRLRYDAIVQRQAWDMPTIRGMEYDDYDNLATVYLVWADKYGTALGATRLYPTTLPYMLERVFSHIVTERLPKAESSLEGSRFCIRKDIPAAQRKKIVAELTLGYIEYSLSHNIKEIIGVMYPVYWRSLFESNGCPVVPLGPITRLPEGHKVMAGSVSISADLLTRVRHLTRIASPVLHYPFEQTKAA